MASLLYISEYSTPAISLNAAQMAIVKEPALVEQTPVSVTASSAQSAAFSNQTNLVRLQNDAGSPCNILFGSNPTAIVSSSKRLAANQTEYFAVTPGHKVAAIVATV